MPMVEVRWSNTRSNGRYSDSSVQENEIPPLHEDVPGEVGLSCWAIVTQLNQSFFRVL